MSPKKKKSETHILIVDDQRDVTNLLKKTLESTEQNYDVISVPSGEEALLEIQSQTFDLAVVDYRLPGMTGLELIKRMRKGSETTRFLVVTGYELEQKKSELDELNIVEVLEKPIDLEGFLSAVEHILTGKRKPSKAEASGTKSLGPIPDLDEGPLLDYISSLQIDLGASAVLLADRSGAIRVEKGTPGDLKMGGLGVTLAESFNASMAVIDHLGDGAPSIVHYYDGSRYDLYSLAVGAHFFIIVIFPGDAQAKLGPVLSYGRRTVKNILEMLGEEAPEVVEVAEETEKEEETKEAEAKPVTKASKAKAKKEKVAEEEAEEEDGEKLDLAAVDIDLGTLEEIDSMFDVEEEIEVDAATKEEISALFDGVGTGELKNADSFWDEATKEETAAADGTLSREEAINRGLISDDLSSEE